VSVKEMCKDNKGGEMSNAFDKENKLLSGKDGIVWATYKLKQAEIIQNALLVQNIHSEIKLFDLEENGLVLLKITNPSDIEQVMDFIWRSKSGLRLQPDWSYPAGERNKSFECWLCDK